MPGFLSFNFSHIFLSQQRTFSFNRYLRISLNYSLWPKQQAKHNDLRCLELQHGLSRQPGRMSWHTSCTAPAVLHDPKLSPLKQQFLIVHQKLMRSNSSSGRSKCDPRRQPAWGAHHLDDSFVPARKLQNRSCWESYWHRKTQTMGSTGQLVRGVSIHLIDAPVNRVRSW